MRDHVLHNPVHAQSAQVTKQRRSMSEAASVSARVRHEHPPPTQDSPAPKGRGSLRRVRTLREHIGNPRAISYMNVHHSESSSVSTLRPSSGTVSWVMRNARLSSFPGINPGTIPCHLVRGCIGFSMVSEEVVMLAFAALRRSAGHGCSPAVPRFRPPARACLPASR